MAPKLRSIPFPLDRRVTGAPQQTQARTVSRLSFPRRERTPSPPTRRVASRVLREQQPLVQRIRRPTRSVTSLEPLEDLATTTLPAHWLDQESDATTSEDETPKLSGTASRQLRAKLSRREQLMDSVNPGTQIFLEWSAVVSNQAYNEVLGEWLAFASGDRLAADVEVDDALGGPTLHIAVASVPTRARSRLAP